MKLSAIILACLLSGCAQFKNEVYCSGKKMAFVSWYYGIGVAAKVDNGAEHCKPAESAASDSKPAA